MTKTELAEIMVEFKENYYTKYHFRKEVSYKYRGEIRTRTELEMTEEGEKLEALGELKMFTCKYCGRLVGFNDLEYWGGDDTIEDLVADRVECMLCYEDIMGEDL